MILREYLFASFRYGISTRADGDMGPMSAPVTTCECETRRLDFLRKQNVQGTLYAPRLAHGAVVTHATDETPLNSVCDGMITNSPGIFLGITVADCFPVFFMSSSRGVCGIVHAGWRGVVADIIKNMIKEMSRIFDCAPKEIAMVIGPGIRACHFVVGQEVADKFSSVPESIQRDQNTLRVDLPTYITAQARKEGIGVVIDMNECTYCMREKYFSYRREGVSPPKVMLAYIGSS